jgi:hypothetical protein
MFRMNLKGMIRKFRGKRQLRKLYIKRKDGYLIPDCDPQAPYYRKSSQRQYWRGIKKPD